MRRFLFAFLPVVLVACGGASNTSIFDEAEADSGATSADTGSSGVDTGTIATDSSTPVVDTGTPVVDTGTPVVDTGTPVVDTGTPVVDTGVPPTDTGVPCVGDGAKTFGGHCYFPITPRSFTQARDACAAAGAHLVTITSAAEETFVEGVGTGERWIGLAVFTGSTSFRWITSEPLSYTNWASGEPNGSGYCARLRTDGWADQSCSTVIAAVCERE